jgi:hypothetical protein
MIRNSLIEYRKAAYLKIQCSKTCSDEAHAHLLVEFDAM